MTKDEDYDALSQKYLASIKRDTRVSLGDATVRATHKVMAEQDDSELLTEAVRILGEAQRAIGKILVERQRGMGYFHAEVDWLVNEQDNITKLIRAIKTREKNHG